MRDINLEIGEIASETKNDGRMLPKLNQISKFVFFIPLFFRLNELNLGCEGFD